MLGFQDSVIGYIELKYSFFHKEIWNLLHKDFIFTLVGVIRTGVIRTVGVIRTALWAKIVKFIFLKNSTFLGI